MNTPAALFAIRWLVRDTFRQALATGIFWLMLGVTAVCVAVCCTVRVVGDAPPAAPGEPRTEVLPRAFSDRAALSVADEVMRGAGQAQGALPTLRVAFPDEYQMIAAAHREGIPTASGNLEMAFGAVKVPLARDRAAAVRTIQFHLAGWVADGAGLLLALIWTAGFLPSFLDPNAASVLLAKPVPRWSLLAGKFLGVLVFVAAQNALFVAGTWLALAARTGVWDPRYFACLPMLLVHFAVFYSFSAMLAVMSRSSVVSVVGSIVFWLFCMAMNSGRHSVHLLPEFASLSPLFAHTLDVGYWILPKPLDFHILLREALDADEFFVRVADHKTLAARGYWHPFLSVLASVTGGVVLLVIAAYDFLTADY